MPPLRYHIVYKRKAFADLARLWMDSENRQEITDASHKIDIILHWDAQRKGYSFSHFPEVRFLEIHPLRVYFTVSEADWLVFVHAFEKTG